MKNTLLRWDVHAIGSGSRPNKKFAINDAVMRTLASAFQLSDMGLDVS
jgi:hypothetical protein